MHRPCAYLEEQLSPGIMVNGNMSNRCNNVEKAVIIILDSGYIRATLCVVVLRGNRTAAESAVITETRSHQN